MPFNFDIELFKNPDVRQFLEAIEPQAKRRPLGIKRWDLFLDMYAFSGVIVFPVRVGGVEFTNPFYFFVEKLYDQEAIFIKPVKGEPYRLGSVYGFFGLSGFADYKLGMPVILVEGPSDWAAIKQYYPYVLCCYTSGVSVMQMYYLLGLKADIYIGFDLDSAGHGGLERFYSRCSRLGMKAAVLNPAAGDWGQMVESGFGSKLLREQIEEFKIEKGVEV